MAGAAEKVERVVEIVEHLAELYDAVRTDNNLDDEEGDEAQAAAEAKRDDLLADILDHSEETQAALAASLTVHAANLHPAIVEGDKEAAALGAVILRSLAAHSQAEALRSLMDSPDLPHLVDVTTHDDDGAGN